MEWLRNALVRGATRQADVEPAKYRVHVVTGDRRGAGTDANVYVKVHDIEGHISDPITSDKLFKNDKREGLHHHHRPQGGLWTGGTHRQSGGLEGQLRRPLRCGFHHQLPLRQSHQERFGGLVPRPY
ncbi:hypothetical protein Pmani_039309 [Petrolisthes manimaculis]|uniref:PLAT domain-containing protein n=1 Tax=Petrolisthes manimaculis TaxID=1843537 RepID=A0AAE1NCY0_9EUCA|nr:hypothetical protein Pmani_039309 [Petrolisthes manimaculis]